MLTKVYEIDEDTLETFFSEDAPERPLAGLGPMNGNLLWEGEMSVHPDPGDVFLMDGFGDCIDEWVVVCRLYHPERDCATLIVHGREFEGSNHLS